MEIKLSLELNEVNGIIQLLAESPYKVSEPLITKIRKQAIPQVNQPKVPETPQYTPASNLTI